MRERLTMTMRDQQRADTLMRWREGAIDATEATALLGCSERNAWRLLAAFRSRGLDAVVHGNRGRASGARVPEEVRARVVALARGRYTGVNDSHLAELLADEEDIHLGRSTLRRVLREAGVPSPRTRRRPAHRTRRERMPQAGLMLQLDGSPHDWLEDRGPRITLVLGIDDATGTVPGAVFRDQEDTAGYLQTMHAVCTTVGIPGSTYHDRAGVFVSNPVDGRPSSGPTQLGRAFAELGITSLVAGSPQAKGRVERVFGTLQDRLVVALRLAGAHDLSTANAVLADFLPRFNARFGVPAAVPQPAWRPVPAGLDLGHVLAFRWRRVVANDGTVRVEGAVLQLPAGRGGRSLSGRRVDVALRLDGRLTVSAEGRTLLAVPAPPDPGRLRGHHVLDATLPADPGEAPGHTPAAEHPWRRGGPKAPSRRRGDHDPLTESLSR